MSAWDIGCVVVGSWTIAAVLLAPRLGRALRHGDEVRQPDARDWYCTDGKWRTEAEAADWVAAEDGTEAWDADALPEWINDHDEPLYVPSEWVA